MRSHCVSLHVLSAFFEVKGSQNDSWVSFWLQQVKELRRTLYLNVIVYWKEQYKRNRWNKCCVRYRDKFHTSYVFNGRPLSRKKNVYKIFEHFLSILYGFFFCPEYIALKNYASVINLDISLSIFPKSEGLILNPNLWIYPFLSDLQTLFYSYINDVCHHKTQKYRKHAWKFEDSIGFRSCMLTKYW